MGESSVVDMVVCSEKGPLHTTHVEKGPNPGGKPGRLESRNPPGSTRLWELLGRLTARNCPLHQATSAEIRGCVQNRTGNLANHVLNRNHAVLEVEKRGVMTEMYGGPRNVRFQLDKMVARDYYGRDRQEVLLSQISKIPARLKKVGSRYELAIRVRPAKQWDDEYASSALAEYGLVYCGSIEPLATFDAESRIIICLTDDDTTAALETGTDPTKWEGIAEMMRHQIASEQRTMLPWMKREWSNDIVNRLSLPGVSRGAANGVSARVIIPKSQDMEVDLIPHFSISGSYFDGYC